MELVRIIRPSFFGFIFIFCFLVFATTFTRMLYTRSHHHFATFFQPLSERYESL